jgi:CheY-like chemotaxis protein
MTLSELTTAKLAGLRILLVEDDAVIAMLLERTLQRLGITVLGPVGSLSKALDMAQLQEFDGAILDVTIRGGDVYPVAELLMTRGIPFVLATGYKVDNLPENIRGQRLLRKPYSNDEFTAALQYIAETTLNRAT